MRASSLVLYFPTVVSLACGVADKPNEVHEADLVSASGRITALGGELEIAVSPQDEDGEFVGYDLDESAFSFENVVIRIPNLPSSAVVAKTQVTGIEAIAPAEGEAVTSIVVFDSSGSMSDNDPGAAGRRAAGAAYFGSRGEGDRTAVIDFGAGTSGSLGDSRLLQPFTDDKELLMQSLDALVDSGGTPLYGSLIDALDLLDEELPAGGTIVVLTDGQSSDGGLEVVIQRARERDTEVYAVGLGNSLGFGDLIELGQQTGGGTIRADDASALDSTFRGISDGVSVGRVVVHGASQFDALPQGALFQVTGSLLTETSDGAIVTDFEFMTTLGQ